MGIAQRTDVMTWKMRGITMPIFLRLLRETLRKWWADEVPHLGAALAFYAALAIAPLLMIAMAALSLVLGPQAAQEQVLEQMRGLIGKEGADALTAIVHSAAKRPRAGLVATGAGLVTLLLAATGVFAELQDAMNKIWKSRGPGPLTMRQMLRYRLFSFGMILGVGFLLMVSLVISAILAAAGSYMGAAIPGYAVILQSVNAVVSFFVIMAMFALIFKMLPDATVAWRNVWVGASLTAALFTIGKLLIGMYLGRSTLTSAYGATGSLVVLLLWVFFSSQILFFGAEFTYVYSRHHLLPEPEEEGEESERST